ncbi:MAG: NAD-dependent succinate-semialdehyde dehydrogenase [Janthinobacterium lividum]
MSTTSKPNTIKSINPATNELLMEFDIISPEQLKTVISNADTAFQSWRATSFAERARILNRAADLMDERKEELGRLATLEMGKKLAESIGEVTLSANFYRYYAEHGAAFLADKKIETALGASWIAYEPLGTLLSIQPWNFPYYQVIRVSAPQLMAGNTMILKHASNVPQCAQAMEDILRDAGLPAGVFTNIFLPGSQAERLLEDPRIKGVMLTGSERAGASIAATAGRNIKKATLELGGSDALVILDDADVEAASNAAVYGRMFNAGQACVSPKRIIVQKAIAEQVISRALAILDTFKPGDPMDAATSIAPLSSEGAVTEILAQVASAVEQGGRLLRGGHRLDRPGAYMEPTVLIDVKKGSSAYEEEIFGPVLTFFTVKTDEEAIHLANDTNFGLGGSVFGSEKRAVAIAKRIDSGMVYVNTLTGASPERPFGGTKNSGFGREQSEAGILEFVNAKNIVVAS